MSILEQIDLKAIKYFESKDLANEWLITEFQKNENFILQKVNDYQDYPDLLNKDFIFGFYILNLLFLYDDIQNNKIITIELVVKNNYINGVKKILDSLNLKTVRHAIKIFQSWALDNLNQIFQNIHYIQIKKTFITYDNILDIFLKYPYFDTEVEINKLILLLDRDNSFYSKFLNCKFSHKKILENHFKKFIETASESSFKNKSKWGQNLRLIDSYLKLIKKDKDYLVKVEKIISYCKNQIDIKNNRFFIISDAEDLVNLVNSHNLKVPATKDLSLWLENMIVESLKDPAWTEIKFPLPTLNDEKSQKIINKAKEEIKNNVRISIFYDLSHETSFWYKELEKDDWINQLFDNHRGSYSHNAISPLEMSQKIHWNLFFQFFTDEEVFKTYTDNLANNFYSVLTDLEVTKDEIVFALERYDEIIEQLIEERKQTEEKNSFWYMKKNSLLLSTIEDTIKTFIKHIEKNNFNFIKDLESTGLSFCLGERLTKDFNLGTEFIPSGYISNILSKKAKIVLDYYLCAPAREGGLGIRNVTVHGSYYSKKFLNWGTFISINILFFQLFEELIMNYIKNKLNID